MDVLQSQVLKLHEVPGLSLMESNLTAGMNFVTALPGSTLKVWRAREQGFAHPHLV